MINSKIRKATALALTGVMALSMAACGDKEGEGNPTPTSQGTNNPAATSGPNNDGDTENENPSQGDQQGNTVGGLNDDTSVEPWAGSSPRTIRIGTWFDHYYDSTHTDIYDQPEVSNLETAEMQLANVRRVEDKYNVRIEYINLTWNGIMESINTSIMAGSPDCDIYEADLQFGIPAIMNGYAMAIEDYASPNDDIFTDQVVFRYLDVPGMDKHYMFQGSALDLGAYPLGFNMNLIDEAGLENPQDLYDRGEWTWNKFAEYLRILTKDTDGDGNPDQYGLTGWWTTMFNYLMMSNGTHVASGAQETLSSPATIEVLEFMYQIYQTDKTAKPWNPDDWDANNVFSDGKVAFWVSATWIQKGNSSSDLGFEFGIVPWPVGPSGNQDTNSQIAVAGNWSMIPAGVERPELVYQVYKEYSNWYDGDLEYRDDTEWSEDMMETERNFSYLKMMGSTTPWFDLWDKIGDVNAGYAMVTSKAEEVLTAAQAAEQQKQLVQDYLDLNLGK
ncbi:MAG: extracellular solute-binding protein [Lachnospiraceae bacterium]|nr:extracellular solute-binding protein [Lachnospiraceae bacterium]